MMKPVRHMCTALLCATLLGAGLTAHAAGIKEGLKIAFVPKQINNPYEVIADNGGMDAIKEFKGDGKVVGPSDAGASSQVSYINTLTTQRQDAIVIAANDANALVPYLKRAMAQGIKVVTFDSDTAPEGRQIFVNQANAESIGRGQIQLVAKLMNNEGEFAILSATPNATNQNTWIKWMQEELKKPEYAKMKLVKIAYGNDDDQKSFVETQGLLQAYPNLKAIVAPTSVGIAAAARYISSSSSKGKVAVTGLGTPNQMRAFVKNGTVKAFQLWDPGALGYLAAYAAANLASGTITGKEGDTFEAGKLGKRTVGKSGEVILGPPTTFDASNIDNFNF
ncbi:rhamnose ABC transporter substrate-binding protein [Paraburkholderia tropica]|uniref:Monosaccharide ABC transporter substrate-binding protein, CUT2 family n=1 Tax=Paraburkholderia tropica TaxID=92647 RepID=A0A1A5X0T2_9BURK|nr:rhamnose ABC transporter substrate-binding protein [Paraburkholderia tropica]MBB2978930.1 rhamnose transport system substrate-binding protein [Paraburkholderia tropica]MBB2999239.1 rhamnose transport system substrate-binding protein [Paraburkholderia tropica]MBB6318861.1 rhamnose transport system substrate-binding protein [Paraburkholderia tropica]OBR47082.1 rhamnose ABC transporter substrate-binding protein [Paraburkholderia tropica]QNB14415.1 rhamnose ABC transporter substrate-binding pro